MTEKTAFNPPLGLLVKLGSLVIHLQEAASPGGHAFDQLAIHTLENDEDVQAWFKAMQPYMPVKR